MKKTQEQTQATANTQAQATQPQNTGKGVTGMKEKKERAPRQGKGKEQTPKTATAPKKATEKKADEDKKKTFYVEDKKVNVVMPKGTIKPEVSKKAELVYTHSVTLTNKAIDLTKTAQTGKELETGRLLQGRMLDFTKQKAQSELDSIAETPVRDRTEEQKAKFKANKGVMESCDKIRTAYQVPQETGNAHPLITLYACYHTGTNIPYEFIEIRKAFPELGKAMDRFNIDGLKNGKAEYTPEEQTAIATAKEEMKKAFAQFNAENENITAFDLSISNKDLLDLYKQSVYTDKRTLKIVSVWDSKDAKVIQRFVNELTYWYLTKRKLAEKQ